MCESVGKAELLSDNFDNNKSRKSVDLSLTYHPSPNLITVSFRSSDMCYLLDFYHYGVTDPLGEFSRFRQRALMFGLPVPV